MASDEIDTEQGLIKAIGAEMERMRTYKVELQGSDLVQIVSFLQIALRHPTFHEEGPHQQPAHTVRRFVAFVRTMFEGFPAVQQLIDLNGNTDQPSGPC